MALVGALLALLSLALAAAVCISLVQDVAVKHGEITMITIATYTFYKIGLAAAQAARRKKDPSPLFAALRGIRYAEVAASVLTLQRSMLVSFGGMSRQQARGMDLAAGAAVCTFVLALGLAMAGKGIKRGE